MAQTVTISYVSGTIGASIAYLDLYGCVDSGNCDSTPFEVSASRNTLITGSTYSTVPDTATGGIKVVPQGACSGVSEFITFGYQPTATPTPTPTVTPTPTPLPGFLQTPCGYSSTTITAACTDYNANNRLLYTDTATVAVGTVFYRNATLVTRLTGKTYVVVNGDVHAISTTGVITSLNVGTC